MSRVKNDTQADKHWRGWDQGYDTASPLHLRSLTDQWLGLTPPRWHHPPAEPLSCSTALRRDCIVCVYVWARNGVQHQHHVAINTMSYWLQNQTGSISTWAPNHCWSWMLTLWPHAERWRGSKKSMCLSEINKGRGFVYQLIVTPKRCTLWKGDCLWEHQRSTSSFVRCTRTHAHAHFDEPHLETYSYSTEYSWQREPYNVG